MEEKDGGEGKEKCLVMEDVRSEPLVPDAHDEEEEEDQQHQLFVSSLGSPLKLDEKVIKLETPAELVGVGGEEERKLVPPRPTPLPSASPLPSPLPSAGLKMTNRRNHHHSSSKKLGDSTGLFLFCFCW